jgi:DNA-directed RNA polymerase specialized sigma24 family protein
MDDETWEDVLEENDEPEKRREIPAPDWVFETRPGIATPNSELEALMMSTPGYDIETPIDLDRGDTYSNLQEILGVDLDLDEVEEEVLDAVLVAGLSIREAADILGIPATTVWRIKDSAVTRIRQRINNG